jgi:hypothetical protein
MNCQETLKLIPINYFADQRKIKKKCIAKDLKDYSQDPVILQTDNEKGYEVLHELQADLNNDGNRPFLTKNLKKLI